MKLFKIFMKVVIIIVLTIIVVFGGFLAWSTLTDYKPDAVETLPVKGERLPSAALADTISLLTWNIGYGGLGQEMDFFYEGGKRVRPTAIEFQSYLKSLLVVMQCTEYLIVSILR